MTLLQNRFLIANQKRETRNLKSQLISLENNYIIPHFTSYHPKSYNHISQTSRLMYSTRTFGSTTSLFTTKEWENKLKPLHLPKTKNPKPIISKNPQVLPPLNPEK